MGLGLRLTFCAHVCNYKHSHGECPHKRQATNPLGTSWVVASLVFLRTASMEMPPLFYKHMRDTALIDKP